MATVKCDQSERDIQFRGRIMDTSAYPTATFALTRPVILRPSAGGAHHQDYTAHGDLKLDGRTAGHVDADGRARGSRHHQAAGSIPSIPVTFATWNIPNPSFGPITTQNHGALEFLLTLGRS